MPRASAMGPLEQEDDRRHTSRSARYYPLEYERDMEALRRLSPACHRSSFGFSAVMRPVPPL